MNSEANYSVISTINHWVTALLVIAMLVLGYSMGAAPTEETEDFILGIHTSLGFFVFLFVIWRVGFRLYEGFPPSAGHSAVERWGALLVQSLMLLILVLLVLSGPMYLFTEDEAISVFGWFSVGIPLGSLEVLHGPAEATHKFLAGFALPVLLGIHFLGAIRYFMLRPSRTPADL